MPKRKVRIRGFGYDREVETRGGTRMKRMMATRGEIVDLTKEEAEYGDSIGAFEKSLGEDTAPVPTPEVTGEVDPETGDPVTPTDPDANPDDGGNTGEPEEAEVVEMSDDEIDEWIAGDEEHGAPTVDEIVDAASDKEDAERLLASENRVAAAQNRDARSTLAKGLAAIIGADN